MTNEIKTTYTDPEFRRVLREEIKAVLIECGLVAGKQPLEDRRLDKNEAATYLNVAIQTLYGYVHAAKKGKKHPIPFHKRKGSNKLYFLESELKTWNDQGSEIETR